MPADELGKPTSEVFYLPMHAVYKESSSTTKVHAVFDASALSSSDVSLNDKLLVGPLPGGRVDPFSSTPDRPHHRCQSHVQDGPLGRI